MTIHEIEQLTAQILNKIEISIFNSYTIKTQVDIIFVLLLDDLDITMKFLTANDFSIEFYINIIASISLSSYLVHKLASLKLIYFLLNNKIITENQLNFILIKLEDFLSLQNIQIIKNTVEIIIRCNIFNDAKLLQIHKNLYNSLYESNKIQSIHILMAIKTLNIEPIIIKMLNDKSYRIRYHVGIESLKNNNLSLLCKKQILELLKQDSIVEIKEIAFNSTLFYTLNSTLELTKIFLDLFTNSQLSSELKEIFLKNLFNHNDIFENRNDLIENYLLKETWNVKKYILLSKSPQIEKYSINIIEDEIFLVKSLTKEFYKIIHILELLDSNKIYTSPYINRYITILISLLDHKVHIVRTISCDILYSVSNRYINEHININTMTFNSVTILKQFMGNNNYELLTTIFNYIKYQIRNDSKKLFNLFNNTI